MFDSPLPSLAPMQAAIDQVSLLPPSAAGHRGAVLLRRGAPPPMDEGGAFNARPPCAGAAGTHPGSALISLLFS
jgi:hypothetical protein